MSGPENTDLAKPRPELTLDEIIKSLLANLGSDAVCRPSLHINHTDRWIFQNNQDKLNESAKRLTFDNNNQVNPRVHLPGLYEYLLV